LSDAHKRADDAGGAAVGVCSANSAICSDVERCDARKRPKALGQRRVGAGAKHDRVVAAALYGRRHDVDGACFYPKLAVRLWQRRGCSSSGRGVTPSGAARDDGIALPWLLMRC
jgi:hypothetical protein